MEPAPIFHADLAEGPDGGEAWVVAAADGTRLRVAAWPGGDAGTVLVFPGRNEHVEKYGRTAGALARMGYATVAIDWRGQGHSDRAPGSGDRGHVDAFADYQSDVAAMMALVDSAGLPEPLFLLAHSMGGAIGLRALAEGLGVRAAAFSAPMWGIQMAAYLRPLARGVSAVGRATGLGLREVPVGRRESYLVVTAFDENALTSDEATYDWMVSHAVRDPRLALGRPTLTWLHEALAETRRLLNVPKPDVPAYVGIAAEEAIVDNGAIRHLAGTWPGIRVEEYAGARHELMMERAEVRDRFLAAVDAHFRAAAPAASAGARISRG